MEMEMEMETEMEIFGARKACSQFRFASKWLLTPDFEVLEASGARNGDQKSPKKPPRSSRGALKRLPRGSLEVLWELLEVQKAPQATILETFIDFRASKNPPGGSPSHDLSTLPAFLRLQKGDDRVRFSVGPGPGGPHTLAHALHSILDHWRVVI